ncbi:MAG: hypothetical protein ABWK01_01720 [Infirmifilum sp.]
MISLLSKTSVIVEGCRMTVEELSWRKAFSYALSYVAYVIIYIVIGCFTVLAGEWLMQAGMRGSINIGAIIGGIIVIVVGLIIVMLGCAAAYFKLMSRLISEATSKP